jgi:hypothetical protein
MIIEQTKYEEHKICDICKAGLGIIYGEDKEKYHFCSNHDAKQKIEFLSQKLTEEIDTLVELKKIIQEIDKGGGRK